MLDFNGVKSVEQATCQYVQHTQAWEAEQTDDASSQAFPIPIAFIRVNPSASPPPTADHTPPSCHTPSSVGGPPPPAVEHSVDQSQTECYCKNHSNGHAHSNSNSCSSVARMCSRACACVGGWEELLVLCGVYMCLCGWMGGVTSTVWCVHVPVWVDGRSY